MLAAPFAKAKDALQEQVDPWRRQETDPDRARSAVLSSERRRRGMIRLASVAIIALMRLA
jgi:hypothetical protein